MVKSRAVRRGKVPVAILFYHRVADDEPNSWTIGTRAFQDQLDWLQRNFDLVSLEEAQRRIRSKFNDRPTVSITFDDGYADNTTFALPLLIKRGIPVTYFVTTFHPTTGSPFQHDVEQGRPLAPNSIEALRALCKAGVEIGGHTRNHPDVGLISDPDELIDEIVTASQELQREIGTRIRYFAFPFGHAANMQPEAFRLARENGIEAICSAYGGWNEIGDEGFHLQRIHGGPNIAFVKNWLTFDPRKRSLEQTAAVNQMIANSQSQIAHRTRSNLETKRQPVTSQ